MGRPFPAQAAESHSSTCTCHGFLRIHLGGFLPDWLSLCPQSVPLSESKILLARAGMLLLRSRVDGADYLVDRRGLGQPSCISYRHLDWRSHWRSCRALCFLPRRFSSWPSGHGAMAGARSVGDAGFSARLVLLMDVDTVPMLGLGLGMKEQT